MEIPPRAVAEAIMRRSRLVPTNRSRKSNGLSASRCAARRGTVRADHKPRQFDAIITLRHRRRVEIKSRHTCSSSSRRGKTKHRQIIPLMTNRSRWRFFFLFLHGIEGMAGRRKNKVKEASAPLTRRSVGRPGGRAKHLHRRAGRQRSLVVGIIRGERENKIPHRRIYSGHR